VVEEIINGIYPISPKSLSKIKALIELESFEAGQNFVSVEKKNDKEYFLLEGICGSYLSNAEGLDSFISFFTTKSVLSPHTTRTSKGLSLLNIKALTPVKIASVNAKKFEELMVQDLEIREFGNTVLRNELKKKVEKEIGLASLTAKERLIQFRKDYPFLENLIPHPYIASFLGITNVSLSRLRKELMK
jgi:CRP-like cAMP-binding protein